MATGCPGLISADTTLVELVYMKTGSAGRTDIAIGFGLVVLLSNKDPIPQKMQHYQKSTIINT